MNKQLLIVDDDTYLSNAIANYLVAEGFYVSTANSVECALQKISSIQPDMIITDIMMPSTDGYDFVRSLRLNNTLFDVPIIFLTAKGMTQDRIKGYNLGCNAYLTKPFAPQELLSIIKNLFNNISLLKSSPSLSKAFLLPHDPPVSLDHLHLTNREHSILHLVVKGYRNREIAQSLQISVRSVEKYVSRLLSKTSTRNRTELSQFVAKIS